MQLFWGPELSSTQDPKFYIPSSLTLMSESHHWYSSGKCPAYFHCSNFVCL